MFKAQVAENSNFVSEESRVSESVNKQQEKRDVIFFGLPI